MIRCSAQGEVGDAICAKVEASVAGFRLLEELIRWGHSQNPPSTILDVVIQDEFTHDVVLRWDSRHYLVFDST